MGSWRRGALLVALGATGCGAAAGPPAHVAVLRATDGGSPPGPLAPRGRRLDEARRPVTMASTYATFHAINAAGQVLAWGGNGRGVAGIGRLGPDEIDLPRDPAQGWPVVDLGAGQRATSLSAGDLFACALLASGRVKCWGDGSKGELGLGDTRVRGGDPGEMGDALPAVDLGAGRRALALASSWHHTCALLDDGRVKCWGDGEHGELGTGARDSLGDEPGEMGDALPAVDLGPGARAVAVAAGMYHSCALLDDGRIRCWGSNRWGQLGSSDPVDEAFCRGDEPGEMGPALPAVALGPQQIAVSLASGWGHTCAVLRSGEAVCWGADGSGQLGLPPSSASPGGPRGGGLTPVDLGPGQQVESIHPTARHTCALLRGGGVKCWGLNSMGSLGIGTSQNHGGDEDGPMGAALPFVDLGTGQRAVEISTGHLTSCARLAAGGVKCWGSVLGGWTGHRSDESLWGDEPGEMGDALPFVRLPPLLPLAP